MVVYTFNITDGNGGSVQQTATITINGADEVVGQGATVSGQVFIDYINNIDEVVRGAAPIRDGVKSSAEPALSGIIVQLNPSNGSARSTTTDLQGNYSFSNVPSGEFTISFVDLPDAVMFTGETSSTGIASNGASLEGPALDVIGLQGAISNMDILASSYLASNGDMAASSEDGLQGGSVLLGENGNQELLLAGLGLDGVRFAEIALNESRDAALLTILEDDGDVLTARLNDDEFIVSSDGRAVQFFGGLEDFDFFSTNDGALTQEFENFRNAIDSVLSQGS